MLLLLILLALPLSFALSGLLRKYAVHWSLVDIPNERSSHKSPVPRGGGLAVALVFLALLSLINLYLQDTSSLYLALFGAGSVIALVGFLDDRGHVAVRKRLSTHFIAAIWVLFLLYRPTTGLDSGDLGYWMFALVLCLFLVWLLNLYNFMDGIDAITCSETITVSLSAAVLHWLLFPQDHSWILLILLASSTSGFLLWNFPPARLFLGDAGSAFIGIILGAFSIHAYQLSTPLFLAWLILLGVYIVDASFTLTRRILKGEKFYQAHRTHAYQHAAIQFGSHGRVSLGIALINLFWLFPLATAAALDVINAPLAILTAYLPLIITALHFKAGLRAAQ